MQLYYKDLPNATLSSYLVSSNHDCLAEVTLTIEANMINRILVFHPIIHVDSIHYQIFSLQFSFQLYITGFSTGDRIRKVFIVFLEKTRLLMLELQFFILQCLCHQEGSSLKMALYQDTQIEISLTNIYPCHLLIKSQLCDFFQVAF